jgi:hypothetical protein
MGEVPLQTPTSYDPLPGPGCEGRAMDEYRGILLTRRCNPLGPYRRPMPRIIGGSHGGGRFL